MLDLPEDRLVLEMGPGVEGGELHSVLSSYDFRLTMKAFSDNRISRAETGETVCHEMALAFMCDVHHLGIPADGIRWGCGSVVRPCDRTGEDKVILHSWIEFGGHVLEVSSRPGFDGLLSTQKVFYESVVAPVRTRGVAETGAWLDRHPKGALTEDAYLA